VLPVLVGVGDDPRGADGQPVQDVFDGDSHVDPL